jgi:hypothetical protein
MTAKEMAVAIDQIVMIRFESINVECRIVDVKSAYGAVRLLVQPVAGMGKQWVELSRLRTLTAVKEATNNNRLTA